jgi:hypothetical protein
MHEIEGEEAERRVRQKQGDEQGDKKKEKKKKPTVSDKYNSEDADISLISSDNILFKVHSYQLMAGS